MIFQDNIHGQYNSIIPKIIQKKYKTS